MTTTKRKIQRDCVDGLLLLNKPIDMSSNQALQRVKRALNAKKAGHTGSLDPLATGMLPICLGQATKFSQYLLDADKRYRVVIRLGVRTTTSDAEGDVIASKTVPPLTRAQLNDSLDAFRGDIDQIPSMYSALKYQGKPLYELARQGITVDRPSRRIHVYSNALIDVNGVDITLDIHCSKGTYIRTIADDWGELLGCGAHVAALHRTQVGAYHSDAMIHLMDIEAACSGSRADLIQRHVLPLSSAVDHFPVFQLTQDEVTLIQQGQSLSCDAASKETLVALHHDENFVGVGIVDTQGVLKAKRLLSTGG